MLAIALRNIRLTAAGNFFSIRGVVNPIPVSVVVLLFPVTRVRNRHNSISRFPDSKTYRASIAFASAGLIGCALDTCVMQLG